MKYKVLRSAAHNFAHSFTSTMNVTVDGLTMSHLARNAVQSGASALHLDLLTGDAEPVSLVTPVIAPSVRAYVHSFGPHLAAAGASLDHVAKAALDLQFQLKGTVAALGGPPPWTVPFECAVTIVDDRGKSHVGRIRDTWHVDGQRTSTPQ